MNVLHVTIVSAVFLCVCTKCKDIASTTGCILVAQSDNVVGILRETTRINLNVTLIGVSSELEHELVVNFVVREFQCENARKSDYLCSEIIGVVGDIDYSAARIIHTLDLASRSNLNITLVAAVTFLPVTNLALPNILDMNPLVHYTGFHLLGGAGGKLPPQTLQLPPQKF